MSRLAALTRLPLCLALLGVLACGAPTLAEQADNAQASLSKGSYDEARKVAETALADPAAAADKALSWRLERIRVEATACLGDSAATNSQLKACKAAYPAQVNAELYAVLAGKALNAGQPVPSLEIAHEGAQVFPEQKVLFDSLIEQLKSAAASDSELANALSQLGYT
ncbi:MAG: hypothetical protein ACT4PU_07805 [Planctomycetota bacterium]